MKSPNRLLRVNSTLGLSSCVGKIAISADSPPENVDPNSSLELPNIALKRALSAGLPRRKREQIRTQHYSSKPVETKALVKKNLFVDNGLGTRKGTLRTMRLNIKNDSLDGVGGAYLVEDLIGKEYVFKPNSEEAFDEGVNKDGLPQRIPKKNGIKYGQTSVKEFAAHLLDHGGWAGVPATYLVGGQMVYKNGLPTLGGPKQSRGRGSPKSEGKKDKRHVAKYVPPWKRNKESKEASNLVEGRFGSSSLMSQKQEPRYLTPKFGSLQSYVENVGSADDIGPSKFSVEDVHRIGVLDIRLCNLDRHLGNLLVHKSDVRCVLTQGEQKVCNDYKLIPIDHSYILPDFRELSDANFEWLYWKQAKLPFSTETLAYIESLNPFADASTLKRLGLEDSSCLTLVITTLFLKHCAQKGMTLWDVGSMIQREGFGDKKSVLENIIAKAVGCFQGTTPDVIAELSKFGNENKYEYRITSGHDLRWSRNLNVFLALITECIETTIGCGETQILHAFSKPQNQSE